MPAKLKASVAAFGALVVALSCAARAGNLFPVETTVIPTTPAASAAGGAKSESQQVLAPDESALRYYASRNETQRVNAEIARLKEQTNVREASIDATPSTAACAASPAMRALFDGLRARAGAPGAGQPGGAAGTRPAMP